MKLNRPAEKFSKRMVEMRKPEMTKKISTPTKPPANTPGNAWKPTTASTATARRPSMSARYLGRIRPLFYRHRLREVPRLIDVAPAADGDVVREQLQRDHHDDRRQQIGRLRQLEHRIARLVEDRP